jgi:hypothetical protein
MEDAKLFGKFGLLAFVVGAGFTLGCVLIDFVAYNYFLVG